MVIICIKNKIRYKPDFNTADAYYDNLIHNSLTGHDTVKPNSSSSL